MNSVLIIFTAVIFIFIGSWLAKGKPDKEVSLKLRLFPNWFKKLGSIWILLSFVVSFIFNLWKNEPNYFLIESINLGLFMICFAREKIEDEMTNQIRLKALYYTVIVAFVGVFFLSILEFLIEKGDYNIKAYFLIFYILIVYLVTFYRIKLSARS